MKNYSKPTHWGKNKRNRLFCLLLLFAFIALPNLPFPHARGIWVQDGNNFDVHRNIITYSTNIDPQIISGNPALTMHRTNSSYLYDNVINGQNRVATGIANVGSGENTYCCNTINDTDFTGMSFFGSSDGTVLRHTNLNGDFNGFGLSVDGIIGQQGSDPFADPSTADTHGNMWDGTFLGNEAIHYGTATEIISSQFFVEDADPIEPGIQMTTPLWPPNPSPQNDWFLFTPFSSTDCAGDLGNCPVPPNFTDDDPESDVTENDVRYAQGTYDATGSVPVINWEGKRYLYKRLKKTPSMLNGTTVIDSFYSAMETSNFRLFYGIDEAVLGFYEVDSLMKGGMVSDLTAIKSLNRSVGEADSLLQYAANAQDSATLLSQREGFLSQMEASFQNIRQKQDSLRQQRNEGAAFAVLQNAGISPVGVLEANLKMVNDVFLQTVAQGINHLDSIQFTAIVAVAFQCPNPASSELTVQLDRRLDRTEKVVISIYSANGQLVRQDRVFGNGTIVGLDISQVPNGIYWCRVTVDNKEMGSGKLAIIR